MTEDEMVGWHHRFNGHEVGQTLGDGEEQGSLECCSPWVRKELDTTEQLNKNKESLACCSQALRLQRIRHDLATEQQQHKSHLWKWEQPAVT